MTKTIMGRFDFFLLMILIMALVFDWGLYKIVLLGGLFACYDKLCEISEFLWFTDRR